MAQPRGKTIACKPFLSEDGLDWMRQLQPLLLTEIEAQARKDADPNSGMFCAQEVMVNDVPGILETRNISIES